MRSKIRNGAVTYIGFDPSNNNSWIIDEKGDWTYVNYQPDEFTQVISGYVVKQPDGKYRAFNCMETYNELFDNKQKAIEFVQNKYEEGKYETEV